MLKSKVKRSQFIVGLAHAARGLTADFRVVAGLVKRHHQIETYLGAHDVKKLQLGTSNNVLQGWLNTDITPNHSSVIYLDATRRFPFCDDTFDYIMSEHMIEHVEYVDARFMLQECFRVLKPGGCLRIATPDLKVLLALHAEEKTEIQQYYLDWAIGRFMPQVTECKDVFVINNFFQSWGHRFLYDEATLCHTAHAAGFWDIKFCKPGDSEDPVLRNLESHGNEITEEINQFETIVLESRKAK